MNKSGKLKRKLCGHGLLYCRKDDFIVSSFSYSQKLNTFLEILKYVRNIFLVINTFCSDFVIEGFFIVYRKYSDSILSFPIMYVV